MNPRSDILLINLARSTSRLTESEKALNAQNLAYTRIDAVDGNKLSEAELSAHYDLQLNQTRYHKDLNKGEIACYLSHRKAWQHIVDNNLDFAVILEDDFELIGDLSQAISTTSSIQVNWDYIKLAGHTRTRHPIYQIQQDDMQLVIYNKLPSHTLAQIVSKEGACKLLTHSDLISRPVDVDIQHCWERHLNAYGLLPYVAKPRDNTQSEIEQINKRTTTPNRRWKKIQAQISFWFKNRRYNRSRLAQLRSK
ncbi:glycosyltransferase family 25 protein [Neptunicella marina]|uniref:Glycosyltransferase family 25 protein n=1 Tax=Neptunicella marina TaxID=2125989 RepID=A0A8J6M212_9ALTE|nr:glycosyltransferase family 25 protein [Neptunicella marina]